MLDLKRFPPGFETCDELRSEFMRALIMHFIECSRSAPARRVSTVEPNIPLTLIRYWHDPDDLPGDVQACLSTWNSMGDLGVETRFFCDESAAAYIAANYGADEN